MNGNQRQRARRLLPNLDAAVVALSLWQPGYVDARETRSQLRFGIGWMGLWEPRRARVRHSCMERINSQPNQITRFIAGALAVVTMLALAACGDADSADSAVATFAASASMGAESEEAMAAADGAAREYAGADFDIGTIGRDVIIEMRVLLSSDNIQRTVTSIMAQASALGGGVSYSNIDYGVGTGGNIDAYATLVVKVPPQGIDQLLAGLDDTGTVRSISQSIQDVTEQLVDLDVRIRNARESVANIRGFMDRAEDLTDLVLLESEMIRRQTDLERLEAQQRNISDRVAFSTVTIDVVSPGSVDEEDTGTIGDALRTGWGAFGAVLYRTGIILAILLPFLALAALLGLIWLVVRRRKTTTQIADPHPTSPERTEE